jgi:hypothetical protein
MYNFILSRHRAQFAIKNAITNLKKLDGEVSRAISRRFVTPCVRNAFTGDKE